MKKRAGFTRAVSTPLAALLALALAPAARAQTAEELLAAHAEALGGREALAAVETLRRAGETSFESSFTGRLAGRVELEIVVGEKAWRHSDLGQFETVSLWDGESAWEQGPMGLRTLEGDELRLMRLAALPFAVAGVGLPEGSTLVREKDREVEGATRQVVTVDMGEGTKATVFLDPETHLVTRVVHPAELPNLGRVELVQEVLEYDEQDGIRFPSRVRVSVPGVFSSDTSFDETVINPELAADRFAPLQ
jgi:hypothetical protein